MRAMAAAMSREPVRSGARGSPIFSISAGSPVIVKRRGSRRAVTSCHGSGHEAGAPGSGRTENGATIVRP